MTATSAALDLPPHLFQRSSARSIALSLQRSAEHSRRKKSDAYRSAMSMLTFYVNRAGHNLTPTRKRVLERAKAELRALYGREPATPKRAARSAPSARAGRGRSSARS